MKRRQFIMSTAALPFLTETLSGCSTTKNSTGETDQSRLEVGFANPPPPVIERRPSSISQLGRTRIDPYAWLKEPYWKDMLRDPSVIDDDITNVLEAENTYVNDVMAPTQELQQQLRQELQASRPETSNTTPPVTDGPWDYYSYFRPQGTQPIFARRPSQGGEEQILLDGDAAAEGLAYYHIGKTLHSDDHRLFAWTEDLSGAETYRICVRDIDTGDVLTTTPPEAFGDLLFSGDSQWLFWTWRDKNSRPAKVFRRPVQGGADTLVHEERDPTFFLELLRTSSKAYLLLRLRGADTSEIQVIPAGQPTVPPSVIEPRTTGLYYDVDHWQDRFIIRTNADSAVDFKLMWVPVSQPHRANWRELRVERRGSFITEIRTFENFLVHLERSNANLHIWVTPWEDDPVYEIAMPDVAYKVTLDQHQDFASDQLDFEYECLNKPTAWYRFDLHTRRRELRQQHQMADGFGERYVVERISAPAADGVDIPITLLRRADLELDGRAPLLLYGYGAYGFSLDADFSSDRLPLVNRGWVYAIAHVRGGSDKGWNWYLSARQDKKDQSFADFCQCAETLVGRGYTSVGRIVSHGASAGGLLVGASLNQRPDLFAGVIAEVPFVDVLNTMSDGEHPLVPVCRPEWGDPIVDPAAYDTIEAYSPYDQISQQPYPPVLATTSLFDNRVFYWEPVKWIALLRANSTSDSPLMVRTAMIGGHYGQSGRFGNLEQAALFWAFAITATSTPPVEETG